MSADPPKTKPILFISHKHRDSKIADELSTFIKMQSGGRVVIHQSSSHLDIAPKIGYKLISELKEILWETSVLILLYTTADHEWDNCTWECGVATKRDSPYTKIILFLCGESAPSFLAEYVHVNVRNMVDIQKFTKDFLTDRDFFPGLEEPMSQFHRNDPLVDTAAAQLYTQLKAVLPSVEIDPMNEWAVYPYLQLELKLDLVGQIENALKAKQSQLATDMIKTNCVIINADQNCEALFGVPGFGKDTSFAQLIDQWRRKYPNSQSQWMETLSSQLLDGAMWQLPSRIWTLMEGYNATTWYAPVLNRVRKIPSEQCLQFDIFFYKLRDVDAEMKGIRFAET